MASLGPVFAAFLLALACSSGSETGVGGSAGTTAAAGSGGSGGAGTAGSALDAGTAGVSVAGGGAAGVGGASGAGGAAAGNAGSGGTAAGSAGMGGMAGGGGAGPTELHITTSNIRYGTADDGINAWPNRKALLFKTLKAQAFDTAGLQEALSLQLADFDTSMPEYGHVGVGRDDGKMAGEYSAILYLKERYNVLESGTFWFSDTPEVAGSKSWGNTLPRICTWGRFENKQTGLRYYHFNVHLDNVSEPSRTKSSQLLAKRMSERAHPEDRVIMTGDFNATPDDLAVTYLLGTQNIDNQKSPIILTDAWLSLHDINTAGGTFHSFMGGTDGAHIDYIMFPAGISAKSSEIIHDHEGDVYPSDHYPVSAVLELP